MRRSEHLIRMSHDGEQLYIEYQRGATWDTRQGALAITHLGRDKDLPTVANMHLLQSHYPSWDKVGETNG